MHTDLRSFLDNLRREGDLIEVETECDPRLEIPEIHRRVIAADGPALLFKRPRGAAFPVVTNLFGTQKRVDLAFGPRPKAFLERLVRLTHELVPPTMGKLWDNRDFFWDATKVGLTRRGSGPVTEVVDDPPGLDRLPLLTLWPEDGGPFVTLPLVYTEHPENGGHNLGMYRMQRFDDRTTGMHWQIGKGGGFHHHRALELGRPLPTTVFVGGPPALILSAIAPLPENVPELLLASLVLGDRLDRCDNPVGPHPLVAGAEFAIIGEVGAKTRMEGPFGDHYGYYSLAHPFPVFDVKALAHRKDAIWPATVVGKPRQEDFFIGDYLQELLSPLFPLVMPSVRSLWSYGETGYHSLAGAVVRERYTGEALSTAFRILGEGQLALTKFLLLTDAPVDLKDFKSTLEAVLCRFDPRGGLRVFAETAMDTLDYTGGALNRGSKGALIGVGQPIRDLPRAFSGPLPAGLTEARPYCGGCLVVQGASFEADRELPKRLGPGLEAWPLVVLVDDAREATRTDARFLWTTFTRFAPASDIHASARLVGHGVAYALPIVIDARIKPHYPGEVHCDPDTAALVERRWKEYFPKGDIKMGDSEGGHLG